MDAPWQREATPEYRFWKKVDKTGDCWVWTGHVSAQGYGAFFYQGDSRQAHRVSYELRFGQMPDGSQIDHACRNRRCVNPEHLRIVTAAENMQNRAVRSDSKSGMRGVSYRAKEQKWVAHAQSNGGRRYLGLYKTAEDAERAVTAWRREHMPYSEMDKVKEN